MNNYYILYENDNFTAGPYRDLHRCRNHAVGDASDQNVRVQIHKKTRNDEETAELFWGGSTLVEEW
jgi:hypothetical protein